LYKVSFVRWTSNWWETFRQQASLKTKYVVFKPESRAFQNSALMYLTHNIARYCGPAMKPVIKWSHICDRTRNLVHMYITLTINNYIWVQYRTSQHQGRPTSAYSAEMMMKKSQSIAEPQFMLAHRNSKSTESSGSTGGLGGNAKRELCFIVELWRRWRKRTKEGMLLFSFTSPSFPHEVRGSRAWEGRRHNPSPSTLSN